MLETVKFHIIGALCALAAAIVSFASGTATFAETTTTSFTSSQNPTEYIWQKLNPTTEICANNCSSDFGDFALATNPVVENIKVLSYSIGGGSHLEGQLAYLQTGPEADVLLLTDVDRFCKRSNHKNIAREFAIKLKYNFVFAAKTKTGCSNGHAILSRYPIGNVGTFQLPGGSADIALSADIQFTGRYLHFIISRLTGGTMQNELRKKQATLLAAWAANKPFNSIVAGNFRTPDYIIDAEINGNLNTTHSSFIQQGFEDSHIEWYPDDRITSNTSRDIFDFIFARHSTTYKPGICQSESCRALSDHLPIWTYISLDEQKGAPVE